MRQLQIQQNEQQHKDVKELFRYTPNAEVAARPTDPFVAPYEGSKEMQLAEALRNVNQTVQSFSTAAELKAKNDEEQGGLDALAGKKLEGGESASYVGGWENIQGQTDANTVYREKLAQFHEDNKHLPRKEYTEAKSAFAQSFLKDKSKAYARGFFKNALPLEAQMADRYFEHQQKLKEEKDDATMGTLMGTKIEGKALTGVLGSTEADLKDPLLVYKKFHAFEESLKTKAEYEVLAGKMAQAGLDGFEELVAEAKTQGINVSRSKLAKLYREQMGVKAVMLGMPELMGYTSLQNKAGQREIDLEPDETRKWIQAAQAQKESRMRNIGETEAMAQKKLQDTTQSALWLDYNDAVRNNDKGRLSQLSIRLRELVKDGTLSSDPAFVNSFDSKVADAMVGKDRESTDEALYALEAARVTRKLNTRLLSKYANQLSQNDYSKYTGEIMLQQEHAEADARRNDGSGGKDAFGNKPGKERQEWLGGLVDDLEKLGGTKFFGGKASLGKLNGRIASKAFIDWYNRLDRAGKTPSDEEIVQKHVELTDRFTKLTKANQYGSTQMSSQGTGDIRRVAAPVPVPQGGGGYPRGYVPPVPRGGAPLPKGGIDLRQFVKRIE